MNHFERWASVILVSLCIFQVSCSKDDTVTTPESTYVIQSPVTQRIADSSGLVARVYHDTAFQVSEGVKEIDIHYLSEEGYSMRVYLLQVDLKNPDITLEAAMPYGAAHLSNLMQPLPQMAAYYDSAGHEVVGGVNADFFDRSTAVPRGILALDGNVLKTTWWSARSATFISVLKNGQVYIGDRQDFIEKQDDLQDALGAGPELVWNGVIQSQTDQSVEPRTGAGITKDSVLYFIVADGRYFYWSNGMSLPQLGAMFKSLGAYKAVNLDGGGSSTFVIKNPVAPVIQVRNRPSDGNNRPLGNGWLVVDTKK